MKIAFFSSQSYDSKSFDALKRNHDLTYFTENLSASSVKLAKEFDAVCVFVNDDLNADVLKKLKDYGIKCILLRCAGFNNVDLKEAKELGLSVFRVPAYSPNAVAEHAVALIQTLNRKTHKAFNRIREGNFSLEKLQGFDIVNKTVGVIGTGKIGGVFCKIMLGFGAKVIAFDLEENLELKAAGIKYQSIDEVISKSDIISLHCPLNNKTKHLINKDSLNLMKDGVMLINTSRGALIDTSAVIGALKSKKLGYLGIDVYEQEEQLFFRDLSETIINDDEISRLTTFPNVLITAHQGFFTNEALYQIASTTLKNADDFMNGINTANKLV